MASCTALPRHIFCLWCDRFICMLVQKQQLHWFKWQNSQLQLKWQNFMLWQNFRKKILWKGKCVLSVRGYVLCDHTQDGLFCWWNELGRTWRSLFVSFFFLNWFLPTLLFSVGLAKNTLLTKWVCQVREGFLKYNCYKTKMNNPCSMNNQLKWEFFKRLFWPNSRA